MVTIQELDKKGKNVKKTVVYEEDSGSSSDEEDDDAGMIALEFMEKMLHGGAAEDDDDELDDDIDELDDDMYSEEYEDDEFVEEDDIDDDDEDQDESIEDDDDDEEEEEEEDLDEDESNDYDEDMQEHESNSEERKPQGLYTKDGEELWTLDLRNLIAVNAHQMDYGELHRTTKSNVDGKGGHDNTTTDEKLTIDTEHVRVNEDYLLQKASEGCVQLLTGLWSLDTQKSDAGPMAILPSFFEIPTPRSLPPPPPKVDTKWEKFAKERRISPKEKRSRKVWDESTQSWAHLTGSGKASSEKEWPIMEVKRGDDPFEDPWQKSRDAKKNRVDKNIENRMRNQERSGNLVKGTTMRAVKAIKKARETGREGGSNDVRPAGLPIDLAKGLKRGKELTKAALVATQRSTASLGKFDEMREGEPDRKKVKEGKKRKFEGATDSAVVNNEVTKNMKVLEKVMSGGKEKDRDIRKGKFAKGETGHDYDFDDGLGPSSFKKKKGRAGAGKMKKITKKRIT